MRYFSIILIIVVNLITQQLTAQSNDTVSFMFSKAQIEEKLKYLSSITSSPNSLPWDISCTCGYSIFFFFFSYICPICGGETLYGSDSYAIGKKEYIRNRMGYFEPKFFNYKAYAIVYRELYISRIAVQKVKGINISLDESEFCKHCSPYATNPSLNLLVNINGEANTTTIPNVTYADIQLLRKFLNGDLDGDYNGRPMADYVERIKELLGIKD
jgi:hypothetical protein